jgi:hypothetical protein
MYDEKGQDGFLQLLRDLAPHLETPLVILCLSAPCCTGSAVAWSVQPGVREVEMLEI